MDNTVTVLSMNVRGLFSSVKKRNDVFDWAKGKNTSIVCFKKPIVVKGLKNFGRMNGEIHVFSVILITEVLVFVLFTQS
jgi:hypothetical protein